MEQQINLSSELDVRRAKIEQLQKQGEIVYKERFDCSCKISEAREKVGEKVRITSGPFAEFVGDITEVYPDKAKLRAMVSIFGRETPVELEYKQIQKL